MRFLLACILLAPSLAAASPQGHFLCEDTSMDVFPDDRWYCEAMHNFRKGFDRHALDLFKRAARYGNKLAQYKIGLMYAGGVGTEADAVEGAAWLLLANERNIDEVTERLRFVMSTLPEFEKRQAHERAGELREEYGDLNALSRRAAWVKKMKRRTTGSRLGNPMSAVRIAGASGVTSDQQHERLDAYEQNLRDIITTVEYRDFRVIEPE